MTRHVRLILSVALVLLVTSLTHPALGAPFEFPDTPWGEVAAEYIAAFNAESTDLMKAFILERRTESSLATVSLEARLARLPQMQGMLGKLEPGAVMREGDYSLVIAAFATRAGAWFSFGFTFESEPPHRVASVAIAPTADPTQKGLDLSRAGNLQELLNLVTKETEVPGAGAAFVTLRGNPVTAASGVRVFDGAEAVSTGDTFHLGSLTKAMTATLVGVLVERGAIELSDTLGELLPDMDMHEAHRGTTLRDLLGHRAGFAPFTLDDEMESWQGLEGSARKQRAAFVRDLLAQAPAQEPGSAFIYSNAGYVAAAFILEEVADASWETLMRERLFAPLEMKSAGFGWPATVERPDQPRGHYAEGGELRPQPLDDAYQVGSILAPAGDVRASAGDVARFAQLHLRGLAGEDGLLRAETMADLHAPSPDWIGEQTYAGGWAITKSEAGSAVYTHAGSAGTFLATIDVDPVAGVACVVLVNSGDLSQQTLVHDVAVECMSRLAVE